MLKYSKFLKWELYILRFGLVLDYFCSSGLTTSGMQKKRHTKDWNDKK